MTPTPHSLAIAAVVGLLSGTHTAIWGMYKDAIHEGFTAGRFVRSPIVGIVAAMLIGGGIAAPLSAWLVSRLDERVLGTGVGALIIFLNLDRALMLFGFDPAIGLALRLVVVVLAVVVVGWLLVRSRRRANEASEPGLSRPA